MRSVRLAALAALAAAGPAAGQTFTWSGGGGNPNWSTAGNWAGTAPAAGGAAGGQVELGGTVNTATVMNLGTPAAPFLLNRLTLNADAANGFSVAGGGLRFTSAGANLTVNGGPSVRLLVSSAVDIAAATTIDLTANSTGTDRELALTGPLTGTADLLITSAGGSSLGREVALANANNTYSGVVTVQFGRLDLLAGNALNRGASVNLTGGNLVLANAAADAGLPALPVGGFSQQVAQLSGSSGASRVETGTAQSGSLAFGFNNASTSYTGTFLMNNAGTRLAKVGTGTFTYGGSTTSGLIGTIDVRDGSFNITGNTASVGGLTVNTDTQGSVTV